MPDEGGGHGAKRCPECGVELKPGLKYCDFCGRKVDGDGVAPPDRRPARGTAGGVLKAIVVIGLAIGMLVYVGNRRRAEQAAPVPPPGAVDGKHRAAATCESAIRDQVRGPLRVIAFRSSLVAEEAGGGYAVSGSIELQSTSGDLQRKRYLCRFHRDVGGDLVPDEVKMF